MPEQRPSNSSRSGASKRTSSNERRAPARPRGENPYKRAAKGEAPRGTRGSTGGRKGWGSLTRKGAEAMREEGPGRPSSRQAERIERAPDRSNREHWTLDAPKKNKRGGQAQTEPFRLPPEAIAEIEKRAGSKAARLVRSLREASKAYAAERWGDARKSLRPLLQEVGDAPVVIELNGMLLYRTGKWSAALKELEAAHNATQSFDLYPAMMDCERALKHPKKVAALWEELRLASPSGEIIAEGRIVMAANLADQNRLQDAIREMEKMPKVRNAPKLYHLRSWYVLADLYERAGEVGKARNLFQRIASHDPDLADVIERLDTLG